MTTILASTKKCLAVVLATALLAPSFVATFEGSAFAQPAKKKPLRDQLPPEAQKQWDSAVSLYKAGQWDGARTSFFAAWEASKNPRVLFNVAVCEKNLGRYARAIESFKKELAEGKTPGFLPRIGGRRGSL